MDVIQFAKRQIAMKQYEALCTENWMHTACCRNTRTAVVMQLLGYSEFKFVPFDCLFARTRFLNTPYYEFSGMRKWNKNNVFTFGISPQYSASVRQIADVYWGTVLAIGQLSRLRRSKENLLPILAIQSPRAARPYPLLHRARPSRRTLLSLISSGW
jgi:hypothetical protein